MRRVCAPTLYWVRIRPVVRMSGNRRVRALRRSARTGSRRTGPCRGRSAPTCMIGVPSGAASLHGHCTLPSWSSRSNDTPAKVGCGRRDLVHDLAGVVVAHRVAHRLRELADDLPLVLAARAAGAPFAARPWAVARWHHRAHPVDPPLGVGEGAVLLQERRPGQEDVGELRGLVEEQVLHDEQVERRQGAAATCGGVRVGLGDVLALDEERRGSCRRSRRRTCSGSAAPARASSGRPHSVSNTSRTASSETCR